MEGFREGYEFFHRVAGAGLGSFEGAAYVDNVAFEIEDLTQKINSHAGNLKASSILKGDVAEYWHSGTFNIDAALKGSSNRAQSLKSNGLGSIDILLDSGEKYGSKYDATAAKTLHEQAKSFYERYKEYAYQCTRAGRQAPSYEEYIRANASALKENGIDPESIIPHDPLYGGQFRLVSSDQYDLIKEQLIRKIHEESSKRPDQVKRYQEALDMLRDHIEDKEGNQSIRLSKEEAELLADVAKEGGFDPAEWNLTTEQLISYEYVVQQAFQAGLSAATISIVLKVAPEIIKAINYLIITGEINKEQFKRIGFAAVSGGAEGFIRGSVSAAITTACKAGLWGEALKSINPTIISTITVITMDTMKNAFAVATGKMTQRDLANELVKEMYVSSCSLIMGTVVQGIMVELPVLGFMIGSFVGSVVGSFTYLVGYQAILSFCADTGFTMFGLVEQDYKVPDSVMEEIGFSVFNYDQFQYDRFEPDRFEIPTFQRTQFEIPAVDIVFLRRGVIGVHQVGYI